MNPYKLTFVIITTCVFFIACNSNEQENTKQEEAELEKVDELIKRDQEKMDSLEEVIRESMTD